jgi:hypothetical protein
MTMLGRRSFSPIFSRKLRLLAIAGVFCLTALLPPPARALLDPKKYSDTERVGYAFSKLTGVPPDYEAWIRNLDIYKKSSPMDRREMETVFMQRLNEGFANYTVEDDNITIVADVKVSWNKKELENENPSPEDLITYKIAFGIFAGSDKEAPYFPYQVGKFWVAVIPKNITAFLNLALATPEAADFMKKLNARPAQAFQPAVFEMSLRPIAADAKEPMQIDGQVYWLMLADITNVTIWNVNRDKMIWSYDSPGYESRGHKQMLDLKQ